MRSPGHAEHPGHRVLERRMPGRLQASVGGDVLAESDDVVEVDEDDNPPRYYFPRGDVRPQVLQRTASPTHCPYKGDGVLFAVRLGDGTTSRTAPGATSAPTTSTPRSRTASRSGARSSRTSNSRRCRDQNLTCSPTLDVRSDWYMVPRVMEKSSCVEFELA